MATPAFFPAFGHKPSQLVGREQEISDFLRGLSAKPGNWRRITLVSGFKGMGKTALLLELADWAAAQGYEALWVPADEDWSAALAHRCASGSKVIVICDGARNPTSALRNLVAAYRTLSARGCDLALVLSAEPKTLEGVLSDSVLAFLQRSHRMRLKALPLGKVEAALARGLAKGGRVLEDEELSYTAASTQGHPHLLQLVGSYLQDHSCSVQQACAYAQQDFVDDVLAPMLSELSARDLDVLKAIGVCGGSASIAQLRAKLGVSDGYLQPYRARLLKSGVVTSPRRGQLAFALPCLEQALARA